MALIDKASLLMVPSTYEAGTLYNVLPSGNRAPDSTDQNSGYDQTRADFDFDRGSNASATRIGSDGLIKKYRENVVLHSNSFDNAAWTKTNITLTSGQADKDSGTEAWKISETTANSVHILLQTTSSIGMYTFSVYLKSGTKNKAMLFDGTNNLGAKFNLETKSFNSFYGTSMIYNIEELDNGWARYSITAPNTSTAFRVYLLDDSYGLVYTGDESNNIYIQSAQLEKSLVATDYLESTSVTGKAGVLVDLPRINYDANGENGALLLEPSRANLLTHSEYFDAWSNDTNTSLTANAIQSPSGFVDAYKISAGTSTARQARTLSVAANGNLVFSIYAKKGEYSVLQLTDAVDGNLYANFDLENGVFGNYNNCTPSIEDAGDGWYRCLIFWNTTQPSINKVRISIAESKTQGRLVSFAGNGTDGVYIYGAMLEAGSYVSSYIPTMGTSETRAADSCSVTGASDVIGQTEGTLYWELEKIVDGFDYYQVSDGGTNNWILVGIDSGNVLAYIKTGGAVQVSTGSPMSVGRHKIALAYAANDVVLYLDGVQVGSDTSVSIPATNEIALSQGNPAGAKGISTKTFQCALFNERLSNAELAALTA